MRWHANRMRLDGDQPISSERLSHFQPAPGQRQQMLPLPPPRLHHQRRRHRRPPDRHRHQSAQHPVRRRHRDRRGRQRLHRSGCCPVQTAITIAGIGIGAPANSITSVNSQVSRRSRGWSAQAQAAQHARDGIIASAIKTTKCGLAAAGAGARVRRHDLAEAIHGQVEDAGARQGSQRRAVTARKPRGR